MNTNLVWMWVEGLELPPGADPLVGPVWATEVQSLGMPKAKYAFLTPVSSWKWGTLTQGLAREIFTYCHQDMNGCQSWYGFSTAPERKLFLDLIEVDKVGPGTALKILARTSYTKILALITAGDREAFLELPGVGRKGGVKMVEALFTTPQKGPTAKLDEKAVAALHTLGYKMKPAQEAIRLAMEKAPGATSEELIKAGLSMLTS